jgi:hypothetical protein
MIRSRTEKILEDWQMVARSAQRPAEAPRPGIGRITLAMGIVGTAAAIIVLIAALTARGLIPQPQPSLPVVGTSPSPSTPVGPSPSASAVVTTPPSAVPSATGPTGTPTAADLSAARTAIDQYTAALVRGDYATAWALLGPEDQAHVGTFAAWSAERRAFFQSVAGRYTIVVSPSGVAPITDWLAGAYGASIDLAHAALIEVDYPALAGNNAGYELFIVNPTADGPRIYSVR